MRAARVECARDRAGEASARLNRAEVQAGGVVLKKAAVVILLAVALPPELGAQSADSAGIRRAAERAQVRFERIRKLNLPHRWTGRRDECDARIGRFCHWNSEDDTVPAKDSRQVVSAREALLATLDSLSKRSPRDGWIAGQRVRYLLEAGDDSTAVRAAGECRAATWWCDALRGLALHEAGEGRAADDAFERAIAAMPEKDRCRWTDMSPLLDQSQKKRYGKVGCGKNENIADRLWWLADPFLSVPGNDRKAEHFARHTMAKILEPTRIVYGISWANDIHEMIVRYGWARYWTQGSGTHVDPWGGAISGHEATPNYHFIPASMPLDSLHEITFDLDEEASPERYAPVIANRFTDIAPQIAAFRRGDSALVVAAFDVSERNPFDTSAVKSALVLAPDERSSVIAWGAAPKGALTATVEAKPHLLSLEVLTAGQRHAAWTREGIWLAPIDSGNASVSDILLFAPGEREARELDDALPTALPGNEVPRGKTGFYWEIYGLAEADSALPVSLQLTPVNRNALRRIGESIGLVSRATPLNVGWRDSPGGAGISARSVVLDLSLVPRGRYELRVEVKPVGRPAAASARLIEVR